MAQLVRYKRRGALEIVPNQKYDSTKLPTVTVGTIDTIVLSQGVSQYAPVIDENGNQKFKKDNKTPLFGKTGVRGVRVKVVESVLTYQEGFPNVYTVWKEFEEMVFDSTYEYYFLDPGIIDFGQEVV